MRYCLHPPAGLGVWNLEPHASRLAVVGTFLGCDTESCDGMASGSCFEAMASPRFLVPSPPPQKPCHFISPSLGYFLHLKKYF